MSTLISIAIPKHYSHGSCSDGAEGTENKNHWQFVGNEWFSLRSKSTLTGAGERMKFVQNLNCILLIDHTR
jgi:hypothetical protein